MGESILQRELRKREPFEFLEHEVSLNLIRTESCLREPFVELFKRHGISPPQYNVLRILRGHGRPLPSLEIAEQMITRVPDVTRLVDRLEAAKLVERQRIAEDRRVVLVAITRTGLELLRRLDAAVIALHKSQLAHLTRAELAELNRLLVKIRCGQDKQA